MWRPRDRVVGSGVVARRVTVRPSLGTAQRSLRRLGRPLAGRVASGYSLARMRHEVLLAPDAVEDLKRLRAYDRARVRDAIEGLRSDPKRTGRSRVKRLRGMNKPQ